MEHKVKLRKIEYLTHDVLHLVVDKPAGYRFVPGQATEMAIEKEGFRNERRPFTFTSLPEDDELEFVIKIYPSHNGVTDELDNLEVGDALLIGEPWGAISYQGEGAFIAGGAGITPFLAILKDLKRQGKLAGHQLFFGNKTEGDIILKHNLQAWLGDGFHAILSEVNRDDYAYGVIDRDFMEAKGLDTSKKVYLCGPPPMMESVQNELLAMGVSKDQLVTEEFD